MLYCIATISDHVVCMNNGSDNQTASNHKHHGIKRGKNTKKAIARD